METEFYARNRWWDSFPVGLRVLAVDDDPVSLKDLEKMLLDCSYQVSTCLRAADALSVLRDNEARFDVLMAEIQMPEMNGLQLLAEIVRLKIELPVILFSVDPDKDMTKQCISLGASLVLAKPFVMDLLKLIWQHVLRNRRDCNFRIGHSCDPVTSTKGFERKQGDNFSGSGDKKFDRSHSNISAGAEQKKKKKKKKKKKRFAWTAERRNLFVAAVEALGPKNAVPKKILEYMQKRCKEPDLNRHVISSHLQQFKGTKLYAKSGDLSSVNIQSLYSTAHPSMDPIRCSSSDIPPAGYTYREHCPFNAYEPHPSQSSVFSLPSYPSQQEDPMGFDYSTWTMPLIDPHLSVEDFLDGSYDQVTMSGEEGWSNIEPTEDDLLLQEFLQIDESCFVETFA